MYSRRSKNWPHMLVFTFIEQIKLKKLLKSIVTSTWMCCHPFWWHPLASWAWSPPGPSGRGCCPSSHVCTWSAPIQLFISVLKQTVFVRKQWIFVSNIPRHTASQGKKMQGARTSRNKEILIWCWPSCHVWSVLAWSAPVQLFISVPKQKVFVREQWFFVSNIPRDTASQRKKPQGARAPRKDAIVVLQLVNFYFAGCRLNRV